MGTSADAGDEPAGPGRTPHLPEPTGPGPVGTTSLWLTDVSRPDPWAAGVSARELMVSLWYPAAPYTCPPSDAAQMPAGYLYIAGVPPSLLGQAMPPLALTWAQDTGGIISSLAGLTTWDRALYSGQPLPPRQQHQLESLVSEATGQPIARTTLADPAGNDAISVLAGSVYQTLQNAGRGGWTAGWPVRGLLMAQRQHGASGQKLPVS